MKLNNYILHIIIISYFLGAFDSCVVLNGIQLQFLYHKAHLKQLHKSHLKCIGGHYSIIMDISSSLFSILYPGNLKSLLCASQLHSVNIGKKLCVALTK